MSIWDELVGDRVITAPYKVESDDITQVIFFESGKVIVIKDYGYDGEDVEIYASIAEFEKGELNQFTRIVPAVVVDAPGYAEPQETTDKEFNLSDWISEQLKIQLSEEMAQFVNNFKKADN